MIKNITITSPFWKEYRDLIVAEVLPYQWEVMNNKDIEMTHEPGGNEEHLSHSFAIENLEIAAGLKSGQHNGYTFQDTDVYKWLEAAAYSLNYHEDENMIKLTNDLINLIDAAQQEDGYLVTFFQIEAPDRKFARLKQSHELYTMGHFIEAAVAYFEVTQNDKALKIAIRMADCMIGVFGYEEGQLAGSDGHPEIELALARLYELTNEKKYLNLAKFFIDVRGTDDFFNEQIQADGVERDVIDGMNNFPESYFQAHLPIMDQQTAEGHAVRMVYLCAGMAKIAHLTDDDNLLIACRRFWRNIVDKKMYITGAIGSTNIGESFTGEYDLPNDTMYGETCASVAMAFFAKEMLQNEAVGEYGDILEKEFFNGIISGISLDGTHFFYVNPLEADPNKTKFNPSREHILTQRAEWFGCACCPSNVARLIASIDRYIYTEIDNTILSHQFIANKAEFNNFYIEQESDFPWDGNIKYSCTNNRSSTQRFGIRIPSWCSKFSLKINEKIEKTDLLNGFIYLNIDPGTTKIELTLEMKTKLYQTNDNVSYNVSKVAFQRGPLVYCAEKIDLNDDVWKYYINSSSKFNYHFNQELLGGVGIITTNSKVLQNENNKLYREFKPNVLKDDTLTLVPYYSWANRGESQMSVWINYQE